MNSLHQDIATRWRQMTLVEQLANVGSEVGRALQWEQKNNQEYRDLAFWRAIELLDLTIQSNTDSSARIKELTRLKEVLGDYFMGDNTFKSSPELFNNYFYNFNYKAAMLRGA